MPVFKLRMREALEHRHQSGLTRKLKPVQAGNQVFLDHDGQSFINFSSNDYLGLANDDELKRAWQRGIDLFGCGSGASSLVTGYSRAHVGLESALCEWLGFDRAVLFSSGFSANQALLFGLLDKDDLVLQDKLNHASLVEAGILSPARLKRFKHNDVNSLKKLLSQDALVVTEGVFSMDGDLSPIADIRQAVPDTSLLAVDDAHGIGVLGKDGQGSCHKAGIFPDVLVVTFGKAFGLSGAAILCDSEMGDFLTQFARHHVYSTAIPPSQAYALTHALNMIRQQQWRRDKLAELQEHYRYRMAQFDGYQETCTPIKPFIVGDAIATTELAQSLKRSGCWTAAIRPPTVPIGSARLRITLTASHEFSHIDTLAEGIERGLATNG